MGELYGSQPVAGSLVRRFTRALWYAVYTASCAQRARKHLSRLLTRWPTIPGSKLSRLCLPSLDALYAQDTAVQPQTSVLTSQASKTDSARQLTRNLGDELTGSA